MTFFLFYSIKEFKIPTFIEHDGSFIHIYAVVFVFYSSFFWLTLDKSLAKITMHGVWLFEIYINHVQGQSILFSYISTTFLICWMNLFTLLNEFVITISRCCCFPNSICIRFYFVGSAKKFSTHYYHDYFQVFLHCYLVNSELLSLFDVTYFLKKISNQKLH